MNPSTAIFACNALLLLLRAIHRMTAAVLLWCLSNVELSLALTRFAGSFTVEHGIFLMSFMKRTLGGKIPLSLLCCSNLLIIFDFLQMRGRSCCRLRCASFWC
jgi:hypothetical protein